MAKRDQFNDEDDFSNIRPGNIDVNDLFGNSDEPFEENDVEVNQLKEDSEDYSDYMFDNSDKIIKSDDDDDGIVDDDIGNSIDDSDDLDIVEVDRESDYDPEDEASNGSVKSEEAVVTVEPKEEPINDALVISEESDDVVLEDTNGSEKTETAESDETIVIDTSATNEDDSTVEEAVEKNEEAKEILNEILDDVTPKVINEEKSDVVEDAGFEETDDVEIDNPSTESVNEETIEKTSEKINSEKIEEDVKRVDESLNTSALTSEEKYYTTEADGTLSEYMRTEFRKKVEDIKTRYSETAVLNYLEAYNSKEDVQLIHDQYCYEYSKYYRYINFKNTDAKAALWILVAGEFADMIEAKKTNGEIQPEVVVGNPYDNDSNIVEDENTTILNDHRRKELAENSKYGIDRVIWNIDDRTAEENTSIFDEQVDLFTDFKKSVFYGILKETLESDYIVDMSKIKSSVIINESTGYYPVIDFSTGVRLYCIDTDDVSQYNAHPLLMNRRIPFSFKIPKTGMITRILYSDICNECTVAVISALRKLIGFQYYNERYKINLAKNYVISYTTEQQYLEMFEKGDPDSSKKHPGSSTYYVMKPATNFIGVVVLEKKTDKDIKTIHRTQVYRDLNKMPEVSVDNYDPQFILSAHYIRNDLRLRNPTIPAQQRFVEYTITQYVECNSVIINDGLQVICACIIKEHRAIYGQSVPYSISFEFDRDNLLTPAVVNMLNNHDGLEPSLIKPHKILDLQQTFILPPSRRKFEGVLASEKGRLDVRYFSPQSIQSRYRDQRDLWSRYDLTTQQGRNEFIKSRGFEVFTSPKYFLFDIMPDCLIGIENGMVIRNIQKISIASLADRNSDDTISLLSKQKEMEYYKSLDNSEVSAFQRFLMDAANVMIDYLNQK